MQKAGVFIDTLKLKTRRRRLSEQNQKFNGPVFIFGTRFETVSI